jgi:glyoxylase-like metal-dependent hydrolase (beta-lactamase superfamily II)
LLATIVTAVAALAARAAGQGAIPAKPQAPRALRLYVFDCGVLEITNEGVERYHVTPTEVGETRMSVPCFLIAHPKGTLMWDLGVIPDDDVEAQGQRARGTVNPTAAAVVTRTLKSQLSQLGYRPQDITYFAISHAHIDHSANMNMFAASTWLARQAERDFMYAEGNTRVRPAFYTALRSAKSVALLKDEHDVFGDGQVVIKAAPGHTPGHQVLVLRLASTGRVMLSGDLYHYPQERTLHSAPPDNEFSVQQSAASRVMIEEYLQKTKTALWIEHDFPANAKLKKAPDFYE